MRYRDEEKDGRLELVKTIHSNYETITNSLLNVKVAFMGMCADIERYLNRGLSEKIVLKADLEPVTIQALNHLYPRLSGLSLSQWNELSRIFSDIRSNNAHLYCNKKIIISDDLRCYLEGVVEPELPIVANGNELTIYGAYYVLMLLSQAFQQWPFISSLLSTRNFKDIEKKDFEKFRQSSLHHLQRCSGIGKPGATLETIDLNHTLTREMTGIFLLLEEAALNRNTAMSKRRSFKTVLKHIAVMKEDKVFADRLTDLRNAWFHGCWLEDEVKNSNGEVRKFDFYETMDTLVMLRDKIKGRPRYTNVLDQIHELGAGLLDCWILRMVELTYKVLDTRLLVSSKLQSRVENLDKAYKRFSSMSDRFYQASSSLLNAGPRTWRAAASKFNTADYQERVTRVDELKIIVLENENGFDIGSCHTESKRLVVCNADIPEQFECTINQKRLEDYSLRPIRKINERINVYQASQPSEPSHQKEERKINMNQEKVYLADIAGYQEEKEEAVKLIDVLKNYELYRSKGASIPKGLLLCGMPGVGKTMFAKAISTEAGVPLYEFEAGESENEEATILSIKEVFKKAKETVPSIIFIDELDELVSSTDTAGFYGFQSDYSRKTLKSLLTEIDGIGSSDGVLVIATTNNRSTIPPALKRSGRLEKRITFRAPSLEDRAAIADLYLKKANVQGIKGLEIARKTKGFSGADIKSLINESIIVSVRRKENLSMGIINEVIPTIRFGEIKKEEKEEPKDSTCFHEIGHFLVQYGLNQIIGSLSVEKYGEILGRMETDDYRPISSLRRKDDDDMSAEDILESVSVDLGGMAGEEVFLGKRFCGSSSDISTAVSKIDMLLRNAVFGFEYLPFFEVESQSSSGFSINRMLNKNDPGLRGRKYVEVLTKQYQAAKKYIEDLKPLGMMIYPLLKKRKSLSSEELTRLVDRFQKERKEQQPVEEVHPVGNL